MPADPPSPLPPAQGGKITQSMISGPALRKLFDSVGSHHGAGGGAISIDELTQFVWGGGGGTGGGGGGGGGGGAPEGVPGVSAPAPPHASSASSPMAPPATLSDMEELYRQFASMAPPVDSPVADMATPHAQGSGAVLGGLSGWEDSEPDDAGGSGGGAESPSERRRRRRTPNRSRRSGPNQPGRDAFAQDGAVFERLASPSRAVRSLVSPPRSARGGRSGPAAAVHALVSPPRSRRGRSSPPRRQVGSGKTVSEASLRRLASPDRQRGGARSGGGGGGGGGREGGSPPDWWQRTNPGGGGRAEGQPGVDGSYARRPAWTANVRQHQSTPPSSTDHKPRAAKGARHTSGEEIASRLHGLHQQRTARLDALRAEVSQIQSAGAERVQRPTGRPAGSVSVCRWRWS
jgi:hypothetical protein